ncbi:MAG TPA: heparan-alpha-glucosaminide N-acetyltransferase domain-containing protein [Patescibacteria group bacterium]|nr:heparan-alpha-glucosaminide N-acetyltransferase domain-containing protein [Patescibacteria group bacterium]
MEDKSETKPIRDLSIDFLKGTAVLFMIVTHVNAFFYDGRLPWLNFWTWWGATICFISFVFAYGLGYGTRLARGPLDRKSTLKRLFTLLTGYLGGRHGSVSHLVWQSPHLAGARQNLSPPGDPRFHRVHALIFLLRYPAASV